MHDQRDGHSSVASVFGDGEGDVDWTFLDNDQSSLGHGDVGSLDDMRSMSDDGTPTPRNQQRFRGDERVAVSPSTISESGDAQSVTFIPGGKHQHYRRQRPF
jgi:hypothetical protein